MKLAIVGYGKMGKMIHSLIDSKTIEVVSIIDCFDQENVSATSLSLDNLNGAEVIIDFSSPSSILDNIKFYTDNNLKAIIGTTGWLGNLEEVSAWVKNSESSILYSGNFSIGVALTLKLAAFCAKAISKLEDYDVSVHEIHHNQKADSPSGTALMLANTLLDNIDRYDGVQMDNKKKQDNMISLSAQRVGSVIGTHIMTFDSPCDSIEIKHEAKNRTGFASGAIKASLWLNNKENNLYTMDDFISELV